MAKSSAATHGGVRPGSGRFPEATMPVRVPASLIPTVRAWLDGLAAAASGIAARPFTARPLALPLPLYGARIAAGFPSPADDHLDESLDLNEYLVQHPAATFFVRVQGDSMEGAGIHHGDLLVVDRAREPKSGAIVVAVINGELTVKRLNIERGRVWLMPENPRYPTLELREGMDLHIWGVVAHAVRSF